MTNAEKFKEVFGYKPRQDVILTNSEDTCVAPLRVCAHVRFKCEKCPFNGWWGREYRGCFEVKEEFDDDRK